MKKLLSSNIFIFLLIVAVQVLYRLPYLAHSGFWHDEAFSLYYSQQHWGHLKHISEWDINPPLYYYFLWIWQNLFGIGEYAVRFSSVIFGALAAGMLYLFCARNINRGAGLISVMFFSISSEMYFYAHEARPYMLIILLVLCSSYVFMEMLRKPGWVNAVVLGFLNFGLIYLHYISGIIILFQVFLILLYFNKALFKFSSVSLGITLLIAILRFTKKTIALILHNEKSSGWIQKPTFYDLKETFYGFFNGADLFYIFLFAAFVVFVYLLREKHWKSLWSTDKKLLNYILLCGPVTIIICFLISLFMPLFVRRYLLFTAPFMYMFLAYFISRMPEAVRYPLMALVGVFMCFSVMRIDFKTPKGMDYRNAVALVKEIQQKGASVLVETPDVGALFSYYYDRNIYTDYGNIDGRLKEKGVYLVANANDAAAAGIEKGNCVVLTQTFEKLNPDDKALMEYISKNFPRRAIIRSYAGITINVYSR